MSPNRLLSFRMLLWSAPLVLWSCSGIGSQSHLLYHPTLITAPGLVYHYSIAQQSHTFSTEKGAKVSRSNNLFLSMHMEGGAAGDKDVRIGYDTLAIHQQTGSKELNLDSGGDGLLEAFNGAILDARLDDQGKVTGLSGLRQIYQKMGIGSDVFHLEGQFDESYFTHLFDKSWNIFPAWGVRVGDSWNQEDSLDADPHIPLQAEFTLVNVENGVLHIRTDAEVDIRNEDLENRGQLSLKGKQVGFLDVDAATGIILNGRSTLRAEGNLKMGATSIPMVVDSTYTVTALPA